MDAKDWIRVRLDRISWNKLDVIKQSYLLFFIGRNRLYLYNKINWCIHETF